MKRGQRKSSQYIVEDDDDEEGEEETITETPYPYSKPKSKSETISNDTRIDIGESIQRQKTYSQKKEALIE